MDKHFFDTVRPMFRGLKQHQVEGCERIIEYAAKRGMSRLHLAYVLASAYHETAKWMQPIREGARRFGPDYSDAAARRATPCLLGRITSLTMAGVLFRSLGTTTIRSSVLRSTRIKP